MFTEREEALRAPTKAGSESGREHFLMLLHYWGTLTPCFIFHMPLHTQAQSIYIPRQPPTASQTVQAAPAR